MGDEPRDTGPLGAPLGAAERAMMDDYLHARGYDRERIEALPAEERERLRKEAALYASAQLEAIDAEARLVHRFHDAGGTSHTAGD